MRDIFLIGFASSIPNRNHRHDDSVAFIKREKRRLRLIEQGDGNDIDKMAIQLPQLSPISLKKIIRQFRLQTIQIVNNDDRFLLLSLLTDFYGFR